MSNIFDFLDESSEDFENDTFNEAIDFLENSDDYVEESDSDEIDTDVDDTNIEEESSHYLEAVDNMEKIVVEDPYDGFF